MPETDQQTATVIGDTRKVFSPSANERRILSIIKRAGAYPAAEIARLAGLSAQSASVMTRALEADGLIKKGDPTRGKVGKPLTPFMLNPDGAFSLGLRIGRRSSDMVLLDVTGAVRGHIGARYPYPTPGDITGMARDGLAELLGTLTPALRARVVGLGVAAPFEMWKWLHGGQAERDEMMAWKGFDLAEAFAGFTDLPVLIANDSSMACNGEHAFGSAADFSDFVYFYVGSLVGAGVVLENRIYLGPTGNAAAFGSLPFRAPDGAWVQLNSQASMVQLEDALDARLPGRGLDILQGQDWSGFDDVVQDWLDRTAEYLAYAALTAVAAYDVPQVVVDSSAPAHVRHDLVDRIRDKLARADTRGIAVPQVSEGQLGTLAGALGAGYQPIQTGLLRD